MECNVNGLPVYYEEVGEGRPLVMLHGWPGDHRQCMREIEPLVAHRTGWRRIYPDMPGMGRTPGPEWIANQEGMLDVVLGFIEAVVGSERFALSGVSYGGYIARGVVHHRAASIMGLFLSAPMMGVGEARGEVPDHQVLVHNPDFVAALAPDEQMVRTMVVVQSLDVLEAFRAGIKPGILAADHAFLSRVAAGGGFSFEVDLLPEPCPAPTLILTGRQDSATGYRKAWSLVDNFPRATYAVLDRAGHPLRTEQRTLYHALVSEWLDRVEEYEPLA